MSKKYIFLTGAPGSRWGRLERMLYSAAPGLIDTSSNLKYLQDHPDHGTQHVYTFWGPYHQHGDGFDRLDLLGPDRIMSEIEQAYNPKAPGRLRFIRCHWFAYQLDWIADNLPEVDSLMVMREPEMCYRWWHESGGWDINYPNYEWYSNDRNLKREIMTQTKLMQKFITERKLMMSYNLSQPEEWLQANMPEVELLNRGIVTQPLDDTLWPILYRGSHETNTA